MKQKWVEVIHRWRWGEVVGAGRGWCGWKWSWVEVGKAWCWAEAGGSGGGWVGTEVVASGSNWVKVMQPSGNN